ncbi:MAG: 4-hydroxy-tetrahydrodipicolinate reductase [Syntrophaceae bacterium CG2_30_49_12]|nr:MAG: 4-hydroxy-tetrahydrodipicolinate reductase [Syntrophaceae bacterium CG2_30_49_12]PIP04986.1 MAG: 4-hydroxy-tetrahydrodipicolinate reductase [Syntrophobacterales bacterium CG23_combo_of_CG06-09_8_20_14_all_48_27]PJC75093.1 MAG: 4-hydroxy-tetrahydrodipicolinate reductase [Syntrophobacterales bacterium CG_4_8_14_3_um_filter_49_14]
MVKAIVTGAGGRMGGRIISLIYSAADIDLAGAVEQAGHRVIGRDAGESLECGKMGVIVDDHLKTCIDRGNVIIDFTSHEASLRHLEIAVERQCAIVIGSTGFTAEEMERVASMAGKTRCVLSPNMSVGVNVMFKVLEYVAGILGDDYDVEITEAHHRLKKDAPSGTADKMARIIAGVLGRDLGKVAVYGRKGIIGERTKDEIGIQTLRAGDIVGEHTVMFGGVGERLEFVHRAHSRDNFARGAIRAAKWILDQKNGLYDMQDVLGLKDSRKS